MHRRCLLSVLLLFSASLQGSRKTVRLSGDGGTLGGSGLGGLVLLLLVLAELLGKERLELLVLELGSGLDLVPDVSCAVVKGLLRQPSRGRGEEKRTGGKESDYSQTWRNVQLTCEEELGDRGSCSSVHNLVRLQQT